MRRIVLLIVLVLTATTALADSAADAKATEAAFAKAFADRDAARFASFIADDATFFGQTRMLAGKQAIVDGWLPLLKDAKAPFSWRPERVAVNRAGDLAFTNGPVFDDKGNHFADFSSVWQKQKDGSWKIIFDGPGAPVCAPQK